MSCQYTLFLERKKKPIKVPKLFLRFACLPFLLIGEEGEEGRAKLPSSDHLYKPAIRTGSTLLLLLAVPLPPSLTVMALEEEWG